MTLDHYIETLTSLRNRYNAGDFIVRIREVQTGNISTPTDPFLKTIECWEWTDMDGDDFWINLFTHTLNIDCKTSAV